MNESARANSPNGLVCRRQDHDGTATLAVSGEVDLASVPSLTAHLKAVGLADLDLIVDLSGLRYIDSSGIKALLDAHRHFAQTKRRIVLAAPSAETKKILSIVGADQIIPICPTVEDAVKRLQADDQPDPEL